MRPSIKCASLLFTAILLFGCAAVEVTTLNNIRGGQSFAKSSDGLVVGAIYWQQGDRIIIPSGSFGRVLGVLIRNIDTKNAYLYEPKEKDFRLALPPGRYIFERVSARGLKSAMGNVNLSVALPFSPFEINPQRAVYVGTVTITVPDPIPAERFTERFIVSDEFESSAAELQNRFPGIEKVEKRLLVDPKVAR